MQETAEESGGQSEEPGWVPGHVEDQGAGQAVAGGAILMPS